MENNDRQQDGGHIAPQEQQQDIFVEDVQATPQEEQQGSVEGEYDFGSEYDPGFTPEGDYILGSEYDPGFVPPQGRDDPEGGYAPAGGYYPEDDYGPEGRYEPEGGYDPGFIPEGEHTPGSEYDPGFVPEGGYDPIFTWGGIEDDVAAEAPMDAPAADPSGGTPLLETGARAEAAGDPEIEMYSDAAGGPEIEMPPDHVGQAEDEATQEQNDAPDPSGNTPPPEYAEQADADSGVNPNDIEIHDGAGQAEANAGDGETEAIESTPEDAPIGSIGAFKKLKRRDEAREDELGEFDRGPSFLSDYEGLAAKYKEVYNSLPDAKLMGPLDDKFDPKSGEKLDTYEELRAETKRLMVLRDKQAEYDQIEIHPKDGGQANADSGYNPDDIEIHDDAGDEHPASAAYQRHTAAKQAYLRDVAYEEELAEFDTYEKLAAYYKEVMLDQPYVKRNPDNAYKDLDPKRLDNTDTYEELKAVVKHELEMRDVRLETRYELEKEYDEKYEKLLSDPRYDDYDELAAHYKETYRNLERGQEEPSLVGLDTYRDLKIAFYELWQKHDQISQEQWLKKELEQRNKELDQLERERLLEEKDESHTDDSVIDSDQAALEGYHHHDAGHVYVADHGDDPVIDTWA